MDEILLSRILALKVQAAAINAEIEGMKAENIERISYGQSAAYSDVNFQEKAEELRVIGNELIEEGRG